MFNSNFNTNSSTTTSTFSHFGKNKLLFANNSMYSTPKKRSNWRFISNIHTKQVVYRGKEAEWSPLYSIVSCEHLYLNGVDCGKGWKIYIEGNDGIWCESFIKAISTARLHYLNIQLEEGKYKVFNKSFMVFEGRNYFKDIPYCVETEFEEIPESTKYPQIKKFKNVYEYDRFNKCPVYGNETALDNRDAQQIREALMNGDYHWALQQAAHFNHLGTTKEEKYLMWYGYVYIEDPDRAHYNEKYHDAQDTIKKAIATAKRLYHVE